MQKNVIDVENITIEIKELRVLTVFFIRGIRLETSGPYMILDLCDGCIVDLYKFFGLEEKDE